MKSIMVRAFLGLALGVLAASGAFCQETPQPKAKALEPTFKPANAGKTPLDDYIAKPDPTDRKSTRLNSSHIQKSRMPSSA